LPVLRANERIPFLQLWVYLHESMRGEASDALNALALRLQCDPLGRALLARRSRSYKLLAILVLGRLRDKAAWTGLSLMTNRTDSIISIYAFWALVRIDPEAACRNMMPLVASRMDWPVSRIVLILQEAGEA